MGATIVVARERDELSARDPAVLLDLFRAQSEGVSRAPNGLYKTLREAMPDVQYLLDGKDLRASELFVNGTVVTVEPGRSFRWEFSGDVESRVAVDNDDPTRQVTTYHLTVSIEGVVSGPNVERPGKELTVGLAVNGFLSAKSVEALLGSRVAMILVHSTVFDYDPTLWAILQDGELLGLVAANGTVSFPLLSSDDPLLSGGVPTLRTLLEPADLNPIAVQRGETPGSYIRLD